MNPMPFDFEMYELDSHLEVVQQNNDDLSAILGLDTCYSDSHTETLQQSIEEPCSKTQITAEKTQTLLAEATQPTRSASPPISDAKASTSHHIRPTPELTVRKTPEINIRGGEGNPKPDVESMQEIELRLRFLRFKLQTGFLPTIGQPKADEMKAMSLYLKKLECIGNPPRSILRATKITKLLKKIKNLAEIPRDSKFSFKKRAAQLLEKWETSSEKEDPTRPSTGRPVKNDGTSPNVDTDEQKFANMADLHQPLAKSGLPTSGHNNGSTAIPANNGHSHPSPPPSPARQDSSKPTSEPLVIDLTDDDELDLTTESELPRQPADQSLGTSVAKSTQEPRSSSPSSINSEPISTAVRKDQASLESNSGKPKTKKRKRSNATNDEKDLSPASNSAGKHSNDNTPNRQQPQRKTSPGKHLTNEILWMSGSVSMIERTIEKTEKEIDAIREKRVRLLDENEAEMQAAVGRMKESIDLKEYLLAWGAEDEKVTDEWSSLE